MVENDDRSEAESRGPRIWQTAVTLLILISFLGVILLTFYNQVTGRQTAPLALPQVAYLDQDANGVSQLAVTAARGGTPRFLTSEAGNVTGFAVSPRGTAVAYTTEHPDGTTAVKLLGWNGRAAGSHRPLHTCRQARCGPLVWHPDGRRLVIEKWQGNTPRLWWLDTQTGAVVTVLADETAVSQAVAFSSDGAWLSYADPLAGEMVLYAFGAGTRQRLTNLLNSPAAWHPSSPQFLFSDFDLLIYHGDDETGHQEHGHDFSEAIHLYLGHADGDWNPLLSQTGNTDDANPAWSPDGEWIAFGRKPIQTNAGRQLWLMRADGREARPLTADPAIHHGPPAWSPDGRYLLFQRFDLGQPDGRPGLWLLEVSSGRLTQVAASGSLPAWLP